MWRGYITGNSNLLPVIRPEQHSLRAFLNREMASLEVVSSIQEQLERDGKLNSIRAALKASIISVLEGGGENAANGEFRRPTNTRAAALAENKTGVFL